MRWGGRLISGVLALALVVMPLPAVAQSEEPVTGDKGTDMVLDAAVLLPLGDFSGSSEDGY